MAAQDPGLPDIRLDSTQLYREEVFTDRRAGTLRQMTPVTIDGEALPWPAFCLFLPA